MPRRVPLENQANVGAHCALWTLVAQKGSVRAGWGVQESKTVSALAPSVV